MATENQGIVHWFAHLDGSENPPIFNDFDEIDYDENDRRDLSDVEWRFCAATFTGFIFSMIANHRFLYDYGYRLRAGDQAPSSAVFEQLRRQFKEGPHTELPDLRVYRFFNKHANLIIRCNSREDIINAKAEWILESNSSENLYEQAKPLCQYGALIETLKPQGGSRTRNGEASALERIRSEKS